jgi:hypothetical protein
LTKCDIGSDVQRTAQFNFWQNKTARFCRAVFRFRNRFSYSPLPKRGEAEVGRRRLFTLGAARSGDRRELISAELSASLDQARFASGFALADRPAQCSH